MKNHLIEVFRHIQSIDPNGENKVEELKRTLLAAFEGYEKTLCQKGSLLKFSPPNGYISSRFSAGQSYLVVEACETFGLAEEGPILALLDKNLTVVSLELVDLDCFEII